MQKSLVSSNYSSSCLVFLLGTTCGVEFFLVSSTSTTWELHWWALTVQNVGWQHGNSCNTLNEARQNPTSPKNPAEEVELIWVFPNNRGTPKWMIYNGKPCWIGWFGDTTIFLETSILELLFFLGLRNELCETKRRYYWYHFRFRYHCNWFVRYQCSRFSLKICWLLLLPIGTEQYKAPAVCSECCQGLVAYGSWPTARDARSESCRPAQHQIH